MSSYAAAVSVDKSEKAKTPLLTALPGGWPWALAFLLCFSAYGLQFYPALLALLLIMLRSLRHNRYEFVIQLTLLVGEFGFTTPGSTGFNPAFPTFVIGLILLLLLRKNTPVLRKAAAATLVYAALMFVFALFSEETMRVQLSRVLYYGLFVFFAIPIAVFAGRDFSFDSFLRSVYPYVVVISVFYILDAFVVRGWLFVPQTFTWYDTPGITNMIIHPLTGEIVRKYPPGMYMLTLLLVPLAGHQYRVRWWTWVIFALALLSTQTFTVISGFIVFFVLFQGGLKRMLLYVVVGIAAAVGIYYIDGSMAGMNDDWVNTSPMRIYSSVNQIIDVSEAVDDEDLAELGSGRIGQALPKLELLYDLGEEWTGLGFLSSTETDNPKFIIKNEYYRDQTESIEVATNIEITVLQSLIDVGYVGLALQILFFGFLCWIVRKLEHASYFVAEVLIFSWFGLGGFEGLIYPKGLIMVGLAFAVVYLSNKQALLKNAR